MSVGVPSPTFVGRTGAMSSVSDAAEPASGPQLRALAAIGFGAAGAIHLGQVALHMTEGLVFAGFFLIVGVLQVVAAVALVGARQAGWYWLGIAGSAATIGIWLVSRTFGLPFGAEPGLAEAIGVADAAASLLEALTIVALFLWLGSGSRRRAAQLVIGALAVVALGGLWLGARATGAFDPDIRLTGFPPELADRAAFVLVAASVLVVLGLVRPSAADGATIRRPLLRGLLVLAGLSAVGLAVMTLPARGGQNAECRSGPVAEVSGLSHASAPEPVVLTSGAAGDIPLLRLSACGSAPLMITRVELVRSAGRADVLVGFAVRDYVERIPLGLGDKEAYKLTPPSADALTDEVGALLRPGQQRELLVRVSATGNGTFRLDSVRLELEGPSGRATTTFATFLEICMSACPTASE